MSYEPTSITSAASEPRLNGALSIALPAPTLRAYALAAVTAQAGENDFELEYLSAHLAAVAPDEAGWVATLPDYLLQPNARDLPLLALANNLGLTLLEMLAVALAAAVDDDLRVGRALARVQAPVGGARPTLGLLASTLAAVNALGNCNALDTLVTGAAVRSGLLTLLNEGAPLPERATAVPAALCLALRGLDAPWQGVAVETGAAPPTLLPLSLLDEAARQAAALAGAELRLLVIRAGSQSEARAIAAAIAAGLERRAAFIETEENRIALGPWLLLRELLPVFCLDLGPGERKSLGPIPFYDGPVIALCGPDGSVESPAGLALNWSLPVPPRAERETLWQAALGDRALAAELARHHRHSSGRIAHLGRLAHHHRALRNGALPTRADVAAASWSAEGAGLDGLAQPVRDCITDEAMIVTERLRADLELLLLRCRARDGLAEGLGIAAATRYHTGVRALFVGPSGTGKTLAAAWLATQLGAPLYRVDLAAVTSKYIGETEKNLAQLLARAEQAEVILLFDEADSIFGKRTEISDANDRFANSQTNYLLQRIESFDGIAILTSNSRLRLDEAFTRRLDMIVEFPVPGPEERRRLWQAHLGDQHRLTPAELNQLAATADLCGGHIRNVVLAAAVLAQAEARPIAMADIARGLAIEYRKLGRQLPAALQTNARNRTNETSR